MQITIHKMSNERCTLNVAIKRLNDNEKFSTAGIISATVLQIINSARNTSNHTCNTTHSFDTEDVGDITKA